MSMSNPKLWFLYSTALFCNVLWSLSYVFQKSATATMELTTINAWRFLIGAIGIFMVAKVMKLSFRCPKKVIPRLFLLGGICYCFSPLLQIYAIKNTRALNAGILVATEPVFSTIVAVIFLGERLIKRDYIAYSIILLGVGVLSGLKANPEFLLPGELGFNLIILSGVFFESLSTPTIKSIAPYAHAFILAFYSYLIASSAQFAIGFISGSHLLPPNNFKDFLPVIFLGIFCTTIAYSLWYWVANYLNVHKMCLFIFCQPISAAFFGWLMLGEIPQLKDIAGSLLIFTGIFIAINIRQCLKNQSHCESNPDNVKSARHNT